MKIEGHRCFGKLELPENTRNSVIESIKLGLDSIEFDVRCTNDNVMCITHGVQECIKDGSSEIETMSYLECRDYETQQIQRCIDSNQNK